MSTRLNAPFAVGSTVINDGDYIQLGIQDPYASTPLTTPNVTLTQPYYDDGSGNLTSHTYTTCNGLTAAPDPQLYVMSTPYNFQPSPASPPVWSYQDVNISGAQTQIDYNSGHIDPLANTPAQITSTGSGQASMDVMAAPATAYTIQHSYQTFSVNGQGAAYGHTNVGPSVPNGLKDTYTTQTSVGCTNNTRMCAEIHPGGYMALRSGYDSNVYLHLLNYLDVANTTYNPPQGNATPGNRVLTFVNLPSNLWTAQWSVYLVNASTGMIALQNRSTGTYLNLAANAGSMSSFTCQQYTGVGVFNYVYQIAYTWYNNYQQAGCVYERSYGQRYYRMSDTNSIAATSTFQVSIQNPSTCQSGDLAINPMNSTCFSSSQIDTPTKISRYVQFCQNGDLASTTQCSQWSIAASQGLAYSSTLVNAYCAAYPNDTTLCGCLNIQPYSELSEYLSIAGTSLLPYCNVSNCANNKGLSAWLAQAQLALSCNTQICIQGITFNSISNSSLSNVTQNCVLNSPSNNNSSTQPTPTTATQALNVLGQIQAFAQSLAEHLTQVYTVLTILISALFVLLLALFMPLNGFVITGILFATYVALVVFVG